MKKIIFAHEALSQSAQIQSIYRKAAEQAGYTASQVVFCSTANQLVAEIKNAYDDLCVFLSQTFSGARWEAKDVVALRKLPTRNIARIILLINRPREDVFADELQTYLKAELYDVYFQADVQSAKKAMEIVVKPATAERAYAYLGLDQPREVSRVSHLPMKDAVAGLDKDKKSRKKVPLKKYVFTAPVEQTVVHSEKRRMVAVMSNTGEVGASQLALNLALAIAAGGHELAYQEFPPVSKYYISSLLSNEVIQPVQHAVTLCQTGRAPSEENFARGISWYYELSDGKPLSPEWLDEHFFREYFSLPRTELPILLDVGSSYKRLISLGITDCITDVVVAVKLDRLENTIEQMERLLKNIAEWEIRPLIVVLNSEPRDLPFFKDYDVFFVNPEKADPFGVYLGAEEELSHVISELKLFRERIVDAPEAVAPDSVDVVVTQAPVLAEEDLSPKAEVVPQSEADVLGAEPVPMMTDEERDQLNQRIAELTALNASLSEGIAKANENILAQNETIKQCVYRTDYDALVEHYQALKTQYEELQNAQDAAGRDRASLSTAVSAKEEELLGKGEEIARLQETITSLTDQLTEKDGTIAALGGQITERDETIASLQSGSSTAEQRTNEIIAERDALRSKKTELEGALELSNSIVTKKQGEIDSLNAQLTSTRNDLAAAQGAAGERRRELEEEYQRRFAELTQASDALKNESSEERNRLLEQLQAAQAKAAAVENDREEILKAARAEAEGIRSKAEEDATNRAAEAERSLAAQYEAIRQRNEEIDSLRADAERNIEQSRFTANRIVRQAEADAERLKDEAVTDVAKKASDMETLRKQAEDKITAAGVEAERIIAEAKKHEEALAEQEAGIENREHALTLAQTQFRKQAEQLEKDQEAFRSELSEFEERKKDLEKREKSLSGKEEDAKDREARRAERERKNLAKAKERADLHSLKMEERRKGSANSLTFLLCLVALAIAFGAFLYLVYKKGNDEVKDLRNRLDAIEESSTVVLVATRDLPEGSIVTMSDFAEVAVTAEDTSNYISSFTGTLTLTTSLSKGQCLTGDAFEEGGGGQ